MGIERGIVRVLLAGGVALSAACSPIEAPSKNTSRVVSLGESTHQGRLWPMMSKTGGWIARENNTFYKYRGRYCEGEYTPYPQSFGASCEGTVTEVEGEAVVSKGDFLKCPEIPEVEVLDCTLSEINPPLHKIQTINLS